MLGAIALVVVGADQVIKQLVVSTMTEGQVIPVLGDVLQWHFVRNPGAAFSMVANTTWVLTILAIGITTAIIIYIRRIHAWQWAAVFGLVLGGALGNLIDRLFREPSFGEGHVVDFISTPWMMPAIYNIADIAICTGMAALVLLVLLDIGFDGSRPATRKAQADADTDMSADASATTTAAPAVTAPAADKKAADERAADKRGAEEAR